MSIILKALKSSAQKGNKEAEPFLGEGEGIFQGTPSIVKRSSFWGPEPFLSKRIPILISILAVLLGFSFAFRWIQNGHRPRKVPAIVEITPTPEPAAVSLPQPQEEPVVVPVEAVVLQVNQAFEEGDWLTSMELLKQLLAQSPNDARLHNNLGFVFYRQGLLTNASTEYQKALELDGKCAVCFNNLGLLKSSLGEAMEARNYFEKAIELSSDYADPYFNLAVLCEQQGDVGHAIQNYRQFLERHPHPQEELVYKIKARISKLTD
ncbi:MAG: tetratricopeptide repeat protein [Deltaproteobacteria bacterium]|nr:tetratricopeptide repeat protein [Deltaproteobacteria bacterium]